MKKLFILTIAVSLCSTYLNAQGLSQKDNASIDNLFRSNLVINKERIVSDTLSLVFKGNFYMVDPKIKLEDEEDVYSCRTLISIVNGVIYNRLDTSLLPVLQDNFYIRSEKDAVIFETALDKLYPVQEDEKELKEHLKTGNIWYFIRSDFFEDKSGYKVTINKDSKVTGIVYDMKAIKGK
jgi:hypothetical protein